MANLAHIQELLNTDHEYRSRFLKDPVAALAEHGFILPYVMQQNLRRMVWEAQNQGPSVPGAAVGQFGSSILQTTPLRGVNPRQIPLIIAFE
jgi:hypothetical protein